MRTREACPRCLHIALTRQRIHMPRVLHLVVGGSVRGFELILSKEIQPRRRIRIDARALLMHIVECCEKGCGYVRKLVDMSLVLHDCILQRLQNAALRDIADAARLLDAQGVVRDPVLLVVDRRAHLERQRAFALYERHAVRHDCILPVCFLVNIDVRNLGELVYKEIALVAQIVRLAAVRLGKHDVFVEPCDFLGKAVDLADLNPHLIVL